MRTLANPSPAVGIPDKGNHALRRYFITYARRGGARKHMLERVTHNASGDIIDVYTDADGIWPALCEAVLCLNVQWPRDNVLQLPLAASVGWDKLTDKLGHETEKRNEGDGLLAPAVGLEPSPEDPGARDSAAIARKGVDGRTSPKPSESDSTEPGGTRVRDFRSADAPLAQVRRALGALRVV